MALDPRTAREKRAEEEARKREEIPPLNPEFPYKREPFDPAFFNVMKLRLPEEQRAGA